MKRVYLGLGSNMGDREAYLRAAIEKLHGPDLNVLRVSKVYESAAMEMTEQADFLNLVVEAETSLLPMRLLQRVLRVESEMGRKRLVAKGPRTIDIDLLLYGNAVIRRADLRVPHLRMTERRFVLEPLAELVPSLRHPVDRRPISELLRLVSGQHLFETALSLGVPGRSGQEGA